MNAKSPDRPHAPVNAKSPDRPNAPQQNPAVMELQHLVGKQQDRGFTLIELLVVIIIIGTLSAIALPSFLNQANKAKQSEAKQYVGTLTRVQQTYYLEKSEFASDMIALANPVPTSTDNYDYTFSPVTPTSTHVVDYGTSKATALKSYNGMVAISVVTASSDTTTTAVLCEAKIPGATKPANPTAPATGSADKPACNGEANTL